MKELFKKMNESIFKSKKDIKWYDKEGILVLNDNRYVCFSIDDVGTRDYFNGFHVNLYGNDIGLIKSKFFRFSHYLDINHIWYNGGKLDWYTVVNNKHQPKPTDKELKEFVSIIFDYIDKIK